MLLAIPTGLWRATSAILKWLGLSLGEFALKTPRLAGAAALFVTVCLILQFIASPPVMDLIQDKWPTWDAFKIWLSEVISYYWSQAMDQ